MQPAEGVIEKFGGQCALARLIGKHQSTVQHWANSGSIPAKWQSRLLQLAREQGVELSTADLVGDSVHHHIVHFYNDDSFLAEQVARFLATAFETGNTAIIVATRAHRDKVATCLKQRGFDVAAAIRQRRYVALDAAKTLAKFMVEEQPDRARFMAVLQPIIERGTRAARREQSRVFVFGEMVALLWREGKRHAAVELEQLWNELGQVCNFCLLCGYPLSAFGRKKDQQRFMDICAQHVNVIPAESYSALSNDSERHRTVARLQQRAQAMETQIQLGEEHVRLMELIAGVGRWEMDLDDHSISLSPAAQRMLGVDSTSIALEELLSRISSQQDRKALLQALKRARTGRRQFDLEIRVGRGSRLRVLRTYGRTLFNAGNPLLLGVVRECAS